MTKTFQLVRLGVVAALFTLLVGVSWAADREKVLFEIYPDAGSGPFAGLVADQNGNLYGTTSFNGFWGYGTVFELSPLSDGSWSESTLYSFAGGKDGAAPVARLVLDSAGNIYGTTSAGGGGPCKIYYPEGCGTVFELSRSSDGSWTESILHRFAGNRDGSIPMGDLSIDAEGNLYGTTSEGGITDSQGLTYGTVFELSRSSAGWRKATIYRFSGPDGRGPQSGVTFDKAGNLYGTTVAGGRFRDGTVFQLVRSQQGWVETVLYSFAGGRDGRDGAGPTGDLALATSGALYGTTTAGGTPLQNGTVYKLSPSLAGWRETILHRFNGVDGYSPTAGVILDHNGNLYGTTYAGGTYNCGTVFKVQRSHDKWSLIPVYSFRGSEDGGFPVSNLLLDSSGNLYGTTLWDGYGWGWNDGGGVAFEVLR